jgi:hypothetical protein
MSVRDYVVTSMGPKADKDFGVNGYAIPKPWPLEAPLSTIIHSGQKKTFVDYEIKSKQFVPDAKYDVRGNLADKRAKSDWNKDKRHTLATDVERINKKLNFPEPSSYKPAHKYTEPRVVGAFNLKGKREDSSFISDA